MTRIARVAIEYRGYLLEKAIAADDEIAALDLEDQVMHYWSSGPCDPILEAGLGPRYEVREIDLPDWADAVRWYNDYEYRHNVLSLQDVDIMPEYARRLIELSSEQCDACAALLKVKKFRSEFLASLRNQVGNWLCEESEYDMPLSQKQLQAVLRSYRL